MVKSFDSSGEVEYSIVIPTSNHPDLLRRCLVAMRQARPPTGGWEVLVMDNSEERLRGDNAQVIASFRELRFRHVSMRSCGLMAARHEGVELARGHIVSFIDDDSFVEDSWLEGIERALADPRVVLLGGPNRPEYEQAPPDWLAHLWSPGEYGWHLGYLSLLDFGDLPREISPTFVWGCNYTIRKDIFLRVRGSHPDYLPPKWKGYQGDGEVGLSVKIEALGYKAHYYPLCAIRHLVPANRMTLDYLGARAFFVGLHSSFTQMRREHGLGPAQGVPLSSRSAPRGPYRRAHDWAAQVKRRLLSSRRAAQTDSEGVTRVKQCLQKHYEEGWAFHRREVEADPTLLAYVLRPDYMGENARLP